MFYIVKCIITCGNGCISCNKILHSFVQFILFEGHFICEINYVEGKYVFEQMLNI